MGAARADFHLRMPPMQHLRGTTLAGKFLLQMNEAVNVAAGFRDRYKDANGGARCLKLLLTDGAVASPAPCSQAGVPHRRRSRLRHAPPPQQAARGTRVRLSCCPRRVASRQSNSPTGVLPAQVPSRWQRWSTATSPAWRR